MLFLIVLDLHVRAERCALEYQNFFRIFGFVDIVAIVLNYGQQLRKIGHHAPVAWYGNGGLAECLRNIVQLHP